MHATLEADEGEEPEDAAVEEADTAQLEAELEVLMTHAAKQRAAIEQSRGFRTPESAEAREKRIKDMKARMPCSACKAHGHKLFLDTGTAIRLAPTEANRMGSPKPRRDLEPRCWLW